MDIFTNAMMILNGVMSLGALIIAAFSLRHNSNKDYKQDFKEEQKELTEVKLAIARLEVKQINTDAGLDKIDQKLDSLLEKL